MVVETNQKDWEWITIAEQRQATNVCLKAKTWIPSPFVPEALSFFNDGAEVFPLLPLLRLSFSCLFVSSLLAR